MTDHDGLEARVSRLEALVLPTRTALYDQDARRVCANCDEEYEPDDRDHDPRYCSLECETAAEELLAGLEEESGR